MTHPLVVESMKKAALAWLEVPGRRTVAAWLIWHGDAAFVVHGGGEQPIPGLAEAETCQVVVRSGDNGSRIASWPASVSRVEPGTEEWAEVVPQMLGKRLNLHDPNGAEDRWATGSVVSRLAPAGDPEPLPDGSLAEAPPATPATTTTRIPRTFHRKPRR
jgi:hypothetical protein